MSIELTRIKNDVNGNPRHVVHFLYVLNEEDKQIKDVEHLYNHALVKARKHGGRKFHNKSYGGGIVFQGSESEVRHIVQLIRGDKS